MEHTTISFEGKPIDCFQKNGEMWFCGKNVCSILGYANKSHKKVIRSNTLSKNRRSYSFFNPTAAYNDGKMVYINKNGLEQLLTKSRAVGDPNVIKQLIEKFDLNLTQVFATKEQSCIGAIIKTFAHERYEKQFGIGSYRIDLYFSKHKLAVECDEFGHSDRNKTKEIARQLYIEQHLECKFYRFNPDATDFCIYKTIGELVKMMYT